MAIPLFLTGPPAPPAPPKLVGYRTEEYNQFLVAVSDTYNHRVQLLDTETFTVVRTYGVTGWTGTGSNQLSLPHGIAIYEGNLYVADYGNHRVQVFEVATGKYLRTLIGMPTGGQVAAGFNLNLTPPRISKPQGLCIDPYTQLCYVSEGGNQRVVVISVAAADYGCIRGVLGGGDAEPGAFYAFRDAPEDSVAATISHVKPPDYNAHASSPPRAETPIATPAPKGSTRLPVRGCGCGCWCVSCAWRRRSTVALLAVIEPHIRSGGTRVCVCLVCPVYNIQPLVTRPLISSWLTVSTSSFCGTLTDH